MLINLTHWHHPCPEAHLTAVEDHLAVEAWERQTLPLGSHSAFTKFNTYRLSAKAARPDRYGIRFFTIWIDQLKDGRFSCFED